MVSSISSRELQGRRGSPPGNPAADEARVAKLGYHQELRREFGFFHAFAISFADTSLIVAFYGVFGLALAAAGGTFFWGLLVVLVGQFLVSLVLGEVASTYPLEGSIYQWTREGSVEALRMSKLAISLDPAFAVAYASAANIFGQRKGFAWTENGE